MRRHSVLYYGIGFLVFLSLLIFDGYTLIGYLTRAENVRAVLSKRIGSSLTFEDHEFHLMEGITLSGVRMSSPSSSSEDGDTFFRTDRIRIRMTLLDLLQGKTAPSQITIRNPLLTLRQTEEGELNLQRFLTPGDTDAPRRLTTNISVVNGTIELTDLPFLAPGRTIRPRNVTLDIRPIRDGTGFVFDGAGQDPYVGQVSVQGRYGEEGLRVNLTCEHLNIDPELVNTFSENLREKWKRYRLIGPATLTYQLNYRTGGDDSGLASQKLTVYPQGMSAAFQEFPYPVSNLHGSITFRTDRIEFGVRSKSDDRFIRVNGAVEGYESEDAMNVALHLENIPVDERVYGALPPEVRSFVGKLNLSGSVDAEGYVSRSEGREDVAYSIRIHPRELKGRHEDFSYPVKELDGTVLVKPGQVRIDQLTGRPDLDREVPPDSKLQLQGVIDVGGGDDKTGEGSGYELRVSGMEIPFEPTLRDSVPGAVREVWKQLQPEGTGSVNWTIRKMNERSEARHRVDVSLSDCRIHPDTFDDPVQEVSANIQYDGEGIRLSGVKGTWNSGQIRVHNAHLRTGKTSSQPFGTFSISGENLSVNPPLQEYVLSDPDLVSAVKNQGNVDFRGQVRWFRTEGDDELEYHVVANLEGLKVERLVTLSDIRGKLQLMGRLEKNGTDQTRVLSGGINLNHLSVNGIPLTAFSANFIARDDEVRLQDVKGQMTGGAIKKGSLLYRTDRKSFVGELNVSDLHLQNLLNKLGVQDKNLGGRLSGTTRLEGRVTDRASWTGNGKLSLRNAQLWKLPVFLPVFMKLSITQQKPFTTGEVRFRIRDENVLVRRMKFQSETSRLMGKGRIGFDGDIKLNLQTEDIDPVTIPVIGWAYNKVTSNLVTLQATGTLKNPSVTFTPLPFLFRENLDE